MEFKNIKIEDLQVNLLNPRYVPQASEIEEMNMIIANGSIENLMKDIALYGTDPSENLLLKKSDSGSFIVEEGNRRITAIKILNNPDLVPNTISQRLSFIERVKKIKSDNDYQIITEIQCAVVDDEEKLKHFIKLKHTGENNGSGRISWDTESQIRFDISNVFRRYLLDLISTIIPEKTAGYNFTTIERIIGDPDMRKTFSMDLDRKEPSISFTTDLGRKRFEYVITGLSEKKYKVKDFFSKEDRLSFIEYLGNKEFTEESINNAKDTIKESAEIADTPVEPFINSPVATPSELEVKDYPTIPAPQPSEIEEPRKRTRRQIEPKERKYPFQGVNYKGSNPGISYALHELHTIPSIYDFPFAATTLFRTFFECTIQEFIRISGIQISIKDRKNIKDLSIDSLLQTCCNNGNGNFKSIQQHNILISRILLEANGKRDQDELNVVTHGNYRVPSKSALIDMERRWFEAIKEMINEISGQK